MNNDIRRNRKAQSFMCLASLPPKLLDEADKPLVIWKHSRYPLGVLKSAANVTDFAAETNERH